MSDITITGKITNPFGFAVNGVEVELQPQSGDGNLGHDVIDAQSLARAVDSLPLGDAHLSTAASTLLSGATLSSDHPDDRIQYANGYSFGVDYRDNAEGDLNDATHFNQEGITITGDLASNTFTSAGWVDWRRLIALNLDIDSVGRSGVGAMMVMFGLDAVTEIDFLHINATRNIQINTDPGITNTEESLNAGLGAIVLSNSASYWLIFQLVPITSGYRMVPVLAEIPDGAPNNIVYTELNDIDIDVSNVVSTVMGLSRSGVQIARIDEFKIIRAIGYNSHDVLEGFLRNHLTDKWCFGNARLIEGNATPRVDFNTDIGLPIGSTLNGKEFSIDISGTAIGGTGNSVLTLPTDYTDYETLMYTVIEDGGQTTNHIMMTRELEDNATISTIRVSGNDTAAWNRAARTLTLHETTDTWTQAVLSIPRQSPK